MLTPYERHLIVSYLSNVHTRLRRDSEEGVELARWVAANGDALVRAGGAGELGEQCQKTDAEKVWQSVEGWQALRDVLEGARTAMGRVRGDRTAMRLRRLACNMCLSRRDLALLEILLRYRTQPLVESLADSIFRDGRYFRRNLLNVANPSLAYLLGVSHGGLAARFAPGAPLVCSGLVSVDEDGDITLIGRLSRLVRLGADVGTDVHRLLLDPAHPSELEWTDFDHIAQDRDHVERLLGGAFERGAEGVNVLIHGPPGTGKTEFCKVLARRLGVTLYSVGEADENGGEPSRGERLAELRLTQRLLAGGQESMLLFDEMDDLLSAPGGGYWSPFMAPGSGRLRANGSKVFMNRLLEQAPTPTLWTSNTAGQTCPTVLRRMMFALELRQPSARVRARIWVRQLQRHGIELGEAAARALATEYDVAPGVAAGASAGGGTGRRRSPGGAPGRSQSVPGAVGASAAEGRLGAGVRPCAAAGEHRLVLAGRTSGAEPRAAFLPVSARATRHGQERVRSLPRRAGGVGGGTEAGQRPAVDVGRGHRAAHRGRLRRGARCGTLPRVRRGRLVACRPALRRANVGGEPGQRDAGLDGAPSPAFRVHHQLR